MPTKQISLIGQATSLYGGTVLPDFAGDPPRAPYYINGFFESQAAAIEDIRKFSYCKRPGLARAQDSSLPNLTGLANNWVVQGMASNFDKTKLVFYANNGITANSYFFDGVTLTNKGVPPAAAGVWTITGSSVFTELDGVTYGANNYWAVTDFTKGALVNNTGVWTEITDVDFTGLTKSTNFCALDGYLFIGTTNNRIYNCDLNTPTSWVATSFLTAADTPGNVLWLSRIRNYLLVFKEQSIEFFEDTGNPTPGSPLSSQKQLNKKVGLVSRNSIKEVTDGIIFLGRTPSGRQDVYKLHRDTLELKAISDQFIAGAVASSADMGFYNADPIRTFSANSNQAQVLNYHGKEFYMICTRDSSGANRTWVYDNDIGVWYRWATCTGGNNAMDTNFTPTQNTVFQAGGINYNLMAQNWLSNVTHPPYFVVLDFNGTIFSDSGSATSNVAFGYPMYWVSDIIDLGSRKRKFLDSLEVLYDSFNTDAGSTNTLTLFYRDTDYNQTSPNKVITRSIPYTNNNSKRARITRLGSFRKRNFVIKQTDITNFYPFRIWGIELDYNIGETDDSGPGT